MAASSDPWMAAMRRGDLAAAWRLADQVLAARDLATRDDPRLPYHLRWVWDGRPFAGRNVVVRCYHGLGDTLQFVRFLPALRATAARVTLEVQPELLPLLAHAAGADRVVPFDVAAPIPPETDLEIMELQHALKLAPAGGPYLQARPQPLPGARAGACWQAGGWDECRSVPFAALQPILPPDTVALQRGASELPLSLRVDADICATAGLLAALDCVVTVDTMVAHLAGALGRPVHLLLKADADWRWGEGDRTPWYSKTMIYRQAAPGDWSSPLAQLGQGLKAAD